MAVVEAALTEQEVEALDKEGPRETIAEIAARESEPEPEPTPEPEPEPERQAIPPASVTDPEKLERLLKQEATRHENALKKAYGDAFADRAFCPACLGEGFLTPWPADAMPDEVWEAVKALCGHLDAGEYQTPSEFTVCKRCLGIGQVATGARNEHNAVVICSPCEGRGYFDETNPVHRAKLGLAPPEQPAPAAWTPQVVIPGPAPAEQLAPPQGWAEGGRIGADQWGRWPGHPRHGIDPANNGGAW